VLAPYQGHFVEKLSFGPIIGKDGKTHFALELEFVKGELCSWSRSAP
jgi:hypothetical protein